MQLDFVLSFPDPITRLQVDVRFAGAANAYGADLGMLPQIVMHAVQQVVGGRLQRGELAMPTLAPSLPYLLPEVVQQANARLAPQGVQIASLDLNAQVPQSAVAPAAAAIAAAPTPMQSLANAASNAAQRNAAAHVPTGVNVHVGGFKIGVNANGVNTKGLADQLKDKAMDKLIGCAVVGGVVLLLGGITMFVIAKIVFFG